MKKRLSLGFLVLAVALCLAGCAGTPPASNTKSASLRFDWFTSMTFSGEVVGATQFAKKNGLDLKIEPGSETTDPIKLVLSGSNDFGCISVEKLLDANEKGADLIALGVINQISPTVFVSKSEKNIKTPKDWIGKKVGLLPGGATEYVYRSLLKKEGLNSSQFKEVTASFDLATFISDAYDVRPAFVYDEPVSLELQNIRYDMIEPKDYGVTYVGRVYFARKEFVDKNPELVQAFINTMAQGWQYSLNNPELAIATLKGFESKTDEKRDLISLNKAKPYFLAKDGKVLTFDFATWDATVNELIGLGILKDGEYHKYINDSFITKFYAAQK